MMTQNKKLLPQRLTTTLLDYDEIRKEATQREAQKQLINKVENLLKVIPIRFRNIKMENFREDYSEQKYIKRICQRYVDTFIERLANGNCLVFYGKPGTGKTMLALLMYDALAKKGCNVRYESSLQFLKIMKEKECESHAGFNSLLDFYLSQSFLILDEVTEGICKGNLLVDWERKLLFTLINARYEKKLCTLVITNRTKDEMTERLGEPIVDRLCENGLFLAFTWKSYRKNKGVS